VIFQAFDFFVAFVGATVFNTRKKLKILVAYLCRFATFPPL